MTTENTALLTVVIPTYNRAEQLKKAVKSVIDQNVDDVEIHIFDNCSTDETKNAVAELIASHPNIRYTKRTSNIGSLRNYSEAINSVETPYFIPLADDDWLLEGSIKILLQVMLANEKLGAAISQTRQETEAGKCLRLNPADGWEFKKYEPSEFIPQWIKMGHFEWSSILFRTNAVRDAGLPDINVGSAWDVDLQFQLFARHPVEMIKHQSAVFLLHAGQAHKTSDVSKFEGILMMLQKAKRFVQENKTNVLMADINKFSRLWIDVTACEIANFGNLSQFHRIIKKMHQTKFGISEIIYFVTRWMCRKRHIMKACFSASPHHEIATS